MNVNIEKARSIQGWMSDLELHFLARTAKVSKSIIEVGCFHGRSTRALADNTAGTIYAVDPWNGDILTDDGAVAFHVGNEIFNSFYCNLAGHINSGRVVVCPYKLEDWPGIEHPGNYGCDFFFIDGDHRYDSVIKDIDIALRFNPVILAGHDYGDKHWPGVKKAVDERFGDKVQTVETIWWTKLK